jgi:hypothetical protein
VKKKVFGKELSWFYRGITLMFSQRDSGKPLKISIRINGVPTEIRTDCPGIRIYSVTAELSYAVET